MLHYPGKGEIAMRQPLWNTKIEPACKYCAVGQLSCDGASVLCVKKGVMQPDSHCRAFTYDPLKRVPRPKPKLPDYSAEDFSIV